MQPIQWDAGFMTPFSDIGIVAKQETQALDYLKTYPDFDGRNVIVAILDTGCDPSSVGLQKTPDGKPKFVDVVDATGSGDVDMKKIVKVGESGIITGLSGRKLKIPNSWKNPSGEYHVGLVRAYDFYPKPLTQRLETDRQKKFNEIHDKSLSRLRNEIDQNEVNFANNTKNLSDLEKNSAKQQLDDLKKLLQELESETAGDCGPVFDCLTWNDGSEWLAILETSTAEEYYKCLFQFKNKSKDDAIDLSIYKPMTNYCKRQEYNIISNTDLLSYVLNIYNNGNILSIVVPGGSHGTHVAGIVGGYFYNDPARNGIAPGCQLVSIKIGDTRLGTMETNQGLIRALKAVKDNKCDLINMSYGEPTTYPFSGRFTDFAETLVWKYGVIFLSSAGNDGPCLSTAGAPQAMSDAIIGVGAICTPSMVVSDYGLTDIPATQVYSWSSRGPGLDGNMGVRICAPGGAITSIPQYTLNKNTLMNGTSMASPNACGNVALLLSGLKQLNIQYSPYGISTALQNTALILPNTEKLAMGYGLIQTRNAFEYCQRFKEIISMPIRFQLCISSISKDGDSRNMRGIYIRHPVQPYMYNCQVQPIFYEDCENDTKVQYELKCVLKSDQPWIKVPDCILIPTDGRTFQIQIQSQNFFQNNYLFNQKSSISNPVLVGEVSGYDSTKDLSAGPIFRIPVTVVIPQTMPSPLSLLSNPTTLANNDKSDQSNGVFSYVYELREGVVHRQFYIVPRGCSHAKVTIDCETTEQDKTNRLVFSSFWNDNYVPNLFDKFFGMNNGKREEFTLYTPALSILETTIAQYNLSVGYTRIRFTIEFCSPITNMNSLVVNNGDGYSKITLNTDSLPCALDLSLKFDKYCTFVNPSKFTLSPLDNERSSDLNNSITYSLILEYTWAQEYSGSISPHFPLLDNLLYESYGSKFWMIFDNNKQCIGSGEAFDQKIKLSKQSGYILRLQIFHNNTKFLDKFKNIQLKIETLLDKKPLSTDIYLNRKDLLLNEKKVTKCNIPRYSSQDLYITSIKEDLPVKNLKIGDHLSGGLKLFGYKDDLRPEFRNVGKSGFCSLSIPIQCDLLPKNKPPTSSNNIDIKEEKEVITLEEKYRDNIVNWIKKLKGEEQLKAFESYIDKDFKEKYPDNLELLQLEIQIYDSSENREKNLELIISLCNKLLEKIDEQNVAAYFGVKQTELITKEQKEENKKYKEKKQIIIDTLGKRLNALKDLFLSNSKEESKEKEKDKYYEIINDENLKSFEKYYNTLQQWTDINKDEKYFKLNLWYLIQKHRIGEGLSLINKRLKNDNNNDDIPLAPSKELFDLKLEYLQNILLNQEWIHIISLTQLDKYKKYPLDYRLF